MRKLMLLAALLAMTLVAAVPVWAQQTSGPATGVQAVDAAGAGNVCVQQVQNVNSGNVDIDQAAANINEQRGFLQEAAAVASGAGSDADAANVAANVNVTQTQDVTQAINQQATGVQQINTAIQICEQAFIQVTGASPPPMPSPSPMPSPPPSPPPSPSPKASPKAEAGSPPPKAEAKAGGAEAKTSPPQPSPPPPGSPSPKAEKKAELPPTGGTASLIALGAGALLVGGGLVARRLIK